MNDLRARKTKTHDFNQAVIRQEGVEELCTYVPRDMWQAPPVLGLDELRDSVVSYMQRYSKQNICRDNVLITAGGNAGFSVAIDAMTLPGDTVGMLTPYFFNHDMLLGVRGRQRYTTSYTNGRDLLRLTDAQHAVLSNPYNPKGCMLSQDSFSQLERAMHGRIILDRSYLGLGLDSKDEELVVDIERTVQLLSFSKTLSLSGLRIGAIVALEEDIQTLANVQDCTYIGAPVPAQEAALLALEHVDEYVAQLRASLREKREILGEGLASVPWIASVEGNAGPFLWVAYRPQIPSKDLSCRLLQETGVATTCGSSYGVEGHLRFAYGSIEHSEIPHALDALRSFVP